MIGTARGVTLVMLSIGTMTAGVPAGVPASRATGPAPEPGLVAAPRFDFAAALAAARAALVEELEGYVAWCHGKTLFNEKRKAMELLIELVPDHAEARKILGHVRQKDGTWKAPDKPKAYRDFDKKALAEAGPRWSEVTAGYVQAMVEQLETGTLSEDEQTRAAREALRFDPDNARVHAVLGEVKSDKGWVLPETLRAKERRTVLLGLVKRAFEQASAAAPVPLLEREKKIPLRLAAVATQRLRVLGTADQNELLLTAQAVQAVELYLQALFASKYALPEDTTVFMLADPAHKQPFLAHHPGVAPDQLAYFERLEGGGIPGTSDFAFWTGDTQRRIDGIVRLVMGFWLSGAFQITVDQGWAYEGLGLYLTRSMVRSRLTWLAQPSKVLAPEQDMALRQRLMAPETNWMEEALQLFVDKRRPPLPELFQKGASALTTEDVLVSYALATYLLEVRPEVVAKLLSRLGGGLASTQGLQEALGLDLATFERHLERWLGERR